MLIFLETRGRPDICFSVFLPSRYTSEPLQHDYIALRQILRYLRGTEKIVIWIDARRNERGLGVFPDANWAGDRVYRQSTNGLLLSLNVTNVAWKTAKQGAVALSSTEDVFIKLSEICKTVRWIKNMLKEACFPVDGPFHVLENNQRAVKWGSSKVRDAKHVAILGNFVKEHVYKAKV